MYTYLPVFWVRFKLILNYSSFSNIFFSIFKQIVERHFLKICYSFCGKQLKLKEKHEKHRYFLLCNIKHAAIIDNFIYYYILYVFNTIICKTST